MDKKMVMAGAVAIFAIGMIIGNYAIQSFNKPPEPSAETKSLVGTSVPDFSLLALDGVRENNKQWLGKVQVINFWATWCGPCKDEIPVLIELQNEYGGQGLQVIGISIDSKKEEVIDYAKEMGINYVLLNDRDAMDVGYMLGNDAGIIPYTLIIDRSGKIAHMKYGRADRADLEPTIKQLL